MKISTFFSLMTAILIATGCNKESPTTFSQDSYVVFGHFYGECFGEACVEIFKIENNKLYEDTLDNYPVQSNLPHTTSYVELSNENYEKVKHILNLIPNELLSEDTIVIGQPDAGDWGGFYLETVRNGETKYIQYWLIDKMKTNIPAYLHAFVDSLDNAIQNLQ